MSLKSVQFLLLGLWVSGGDDVVDVGAHKGLDLFVLLLLQHLVHHVKVAVHGVLHQDQVGGQALLHSTFGVLADPLEVVASLSTKNQSKGLQQFCTHPVDWYGLLFTSSVTDMRLNAWMAASCTDSVVAGCLMHLTSVLFMEGLTASRTSPMLPATCNDAGN